MFDAIIQCRLQSTRLPAKILLPLNNNKSSLDILIQNLKKIKQINKIILAIPYDDKKSIFYDFSKKKNIFCYAPKIHINNVLGRFHLAARKFKSKNIIRITSDCPFINVFVVKEMINYFKKHKLSFLTNNKPRYIPHGFDCEIFSKETLDLIYQNAFLSEEKEHVTLWYYKKNRKKVNQYNVYDRNYSKIRLTLDYPDDYIFLKNNFHKLYNLSLTKNHDRLLRSLIEKKNY